MNLKCLLFGHMPDRPEVRENLIPFQTVYCIRCNKRIDKDYIIAR